MIDKLRARAKSIASSLKAIPKDETIRIVGHNDTDGLCSLAIISKALMKEGYQFSLSSVQQLNEGLLKEIALEEYSYVVFVDLGSGYLSMIQEKLGDKEVFVIDHHHVEDVEFKGQHINPHLEGIDGGMMVSGAGMCYLVAKEMDGENINLAHLGIIGAIGDSQEKDGFQELNDRILQDAIASGKLSQVKGLKIYGSQTRPLYKILELSSELKIPGVSGTESGAIQFLNELGIQPKHGVKWRTLADLSEVEHKKLSSAIILKRVDEENPEDIFGKHYILPNEEKNTYFYDAKEFSTLLNACGRLDKHAVGIGICLGSKSAKDKALELLSQYKNELMEALTWVKQGSDDIIFEKGYIIVNAKERIRPTIIGTVCSMISKSNMFDNVSIVVVMGRDDRVSKVSIRGRDVDVYGVIKQITHIVGGESGGHRNAAGALIPVSQEDLFIQHAGEILKNKIIEEKVL